MPNKVAPKDANDVSALLLTSVSDGTAMPWLGDPVTGAALVEPTDTTIIIGTTAITGGSGSTNFLYDNNGVLAEGVPTANITIGSAVSGGTASQLLATDGSTNLQNLAVATYPSLTELSYVKGVTSAIQTQISSKQASGNYVTAAAGKTGVFSNTITLAAGADGQTFTFPASSDTVACLGTAQTWTLQQRFNTNFTLFGTASSKTGGIELFNASGSGGIQITGANPGSTTYSIVVPAVSDTLATIGTNQTFTAVQSFRQILNVVNAVTVSSNAGTVPVTYRNNTFTNTSAATMAITLAVTNAVDGQLCLIRIYDYSNVAQTIGWTNTENSLQSVPTTSNGSTTLPLTVMFQFNGATNLWRCGGSF